MRTIALSFALAIPLSIALGGCKLIVGIDDTKVAPDAAPDATPDAPPEIPIDVGTGDDNDLLVAIGTRFTDDYRAAVTAPIGVGSTRVDVSTTVGFQANDEVLVIIMQGVDVGRFETHRIDRVEPNHFILKTQFANDFQIATSRVQVIRVPNYRDVEVSAGATLTAHPWDEVAGTGGVVFFRATGTVSIAGTLHADALGWSGGTAGTTPRQGGTGGAGGGGGFARACPALGCANTPTVSGGGAPGETMGMGAAGGEGAVSGMCRAGGGAIGGVGGSSGESAVAGQVGHGDGGGAGDGSGGVHVGDTSSRVVLGGGGGAGMDGAGGVGGGGGGGGGGPITNTAPISGMTGGQGGVGGVGGLGGAGGIGGGIVMIHVHTLDVSGTIAVRGAAGTAGTTGGTGANGGFGGYGTTNFGMGNCGGIFFNGGRGGGGAGAAGGDGGGGGGGGSGGTIVLYANAIAIGASATILASGGDASMEGMGGMPGLGGLGNSSDVRAASGPAGNPGPGGRPGAPGKSYIRYAATCDGCANAGNPVVDVMMISSP